MCVYVCVCVCQRRNHRSNRVDDHVMITTAVLDFMHRGRSRDDYVYVSSFYAQHSVFCCVALLYRCLGSPFANGRPSTVETTQTYKELEGHSVSVRAKDFRVDGLISSGVYFSHPPPPPPPLPLHLIYGQIRHRQFVRNSRQQQQQQQQRESERYLGALTRLGDVAPL